MTVALYGGDYTARMIASFARSYAPWTDRAGRTSWLKLVVFLACIAPAIWMAWLWYGGYPHPNPIRGVIRDTGDWAMRFLAASLAITPLRYLTRWNRLILLRRMLGLAGLFYTLAHLAIYVVDRQFNLHYMWLEIFWRIYISAGWVATIIFILMGITSNDWGIRRRGAVEWNRLHALTYPAALLSLLHMFILIRFDAFEAVLILGLVCFAIGFRLMRGRGAQNDPLKLLALGTGLALATALFEALFYRWATRAPLDVVLKANFDFSYQVRPAWYLLAAGIVFALAAWARNRIATTPQRRPAASLS